MIYRVLTSSIYRGFPPLKSNKNKSNIIYPSNINFHILIIYFIYDKNVYEESYHGSYEESQARKMLFPSNYQLFFLNLFHHVF